MSTITRFREASERIDRAGTHLKETLEHLAGEAEEMQAQTYDPTSRSNVASVLVCKEHGDDLTVCHKAGMTCVVSIPVAVHHDPTGEAAGNGNPARAAIAEFEKKLHSYENLARWLDDFVHDHSPRAPRKANPVESRKAEQENRKVAGCADCAKSGKHADAIAVTDANGAYAKAEPRCSWHQKWGLKHHRPPTAEEEATHQRGKNVTRRVMQMDRLRAGLLTGKL